MTNDNSRDETIRTTPQGVDLDLDLSTPQTRVQSRRLQEATVISPAEPTEPSGNHIALPVGYALQEYTIESVLGAGGFGITYLARDNNLQCKVAIKEYLPNDLAVRTSGKTVMPKTEADTEGYQTGLDRFLLESRVLATFRHHNIVRVTRFFEDNRTAYMVMDYEQGESLRSWLQAHGPVDEAKLLQMFLPLLEGLDIVHRAGVVHRDIKPANLYVRDGDGSLVLLDFGAARQTTGASSRSLTSIITPGYAPFEQYHTRGAQGPWTDLYALGGVLYWLVTGQKPLEAPSRMKQDTMPLAAEVATGRFSPAFLAAIDWALRVEEEGRPHSVADLRAALLGETPVPDRPASPGRSDARAPAAAMPPPTPAATSPAPGKGLVFAGIGAAVLIALGGFLALSKPAPPPEQAAAAAEPPAPAEEKSAPAPKPAAQAKTEKKSPSPKKETVAAEKPKPAEEKAAAAKDTAATKASPAAISTLVFEIFPAGEQAEVEVDDKKIGNAPPLREFKLPPGKYKVGIHGNKPPHAYYYTVEVGPNEKKKLSARFADTY